MNQKPKCPNCNSEDLFFTDLTKTSDGVFIDAIVYCRTCNAELNATYTFVELTVDEIEGI